MGLEERRTAWLGLAWLANIVSTPALIVFNSMMMTKYLLMAPITVSAIHLLTTAACVALLEALGVFGSEEKGQSMPKKHLAVFVLISCISLASASYSLAWNTLGLYQMFKLGILPVTFAMELMLALRRYHFVLVTALAAVMVGLFITLYRDSALRLPGLLMATLFVASTGAVWQAAADVQPEAPPTAVEDSLHPRISSAA